MRKHFEGCSALKLIVISPPMNERLFFLSLGLDYDCSESMCQCCYI